MVDEVTSRLRELRIGGCLEMDGYQRGAAVASHEASGCRPREGVDDRRGTRRILQTDDQGLETGGVGPDGGGLSIDDNRRFGTNLREVSAQLVSDRHRWGALRLPSSA